MKDDGKTAQGQERITHTPSTALPWRLSGMGYALGANNDVLFDDVRPKDTAYIIRSANAYPKLVAALQNLYRFEKLDDDDVRLTHARVEVSQLLHDLEERIPPPVVSGTTPTSIEAK